MTPGVPDVNGAWRISVSGSASISARHAMVLPGLSPRRIPTTPVFAMPVFTSSPALCRRSAMISAVRFSWNDSSGWRWKSRRSAIIDSTRLPISSLQLAGALMSLIRAGSARDARGDRDLDVEIGRVERRHRHGRPRRLVGGAVFRVLLVVGGQVLD